MRSSMLRIVAAERGVLAPLFDGVPRPRTVVDSVLEGWLGTADADDAEHPTAARLEIGCYSILGGDPASPAAQNLVRAVSAPRELIFPDDDAWRALLHSVHPQATDRPMQAYATDRLTLSRLVEIASRVADGFSIKRMDAAAAAQLGVDLEPHALQTFADPAAFAAGGIGFCANRGPTVACTATSYAVASGRIELAIATAPAFRRRGLAATVAASLMVHCLARGIVPHWNAGNPVSQRLAERLGYRPAGTVEVLYLP
jgi:RimJ/RimL family protein N-acetyltransferase